jgi:hypothetical protein
MAQQTTDIGIRNESELGTNSLCLPKPRDPIIDDVVDRTKDAVEKVYEQQQKLLKKEGRYFTETETVSALNRIVSDVYSSVADRKGLIPPATGDFVKDLGSLQSYFRSNGYEFQLGTTPLTSNHFQVGSLLFKLQPEQKTFDSSKIEFPDSKIPKLNCAHYCEVEKTVIEDPMVADTNFRHTGITSFNSKGEPMILIFPKAIDEIAKADGSSKSELTENALLNETAHIISERTLPSKTLSNVSFEYGEGEYNVNQLRETFSDLVELKYGKNPTQTLRRILDSTVQVYDFSRQLVTDGLREFALQNPDRIPENLLRDGSSKKLADYISKSNLGPTVKPYVVKYLEETILPVYQEIGR